MNKTYTSSLIAARIWFITNLVLGIGIFIWACFQSGKANPAMGIIIGIVAGIVSFPVPIVLYFVLPSIRKNNSNDKLLGLTLTCLIITFFYALLATTILGGYNLFQDKSTDFTLTLIIYTAILFGCSLIAILLSHKAITSYFFTPPLPSSNESWQKNSETQINTNMETTNYNPSAAWNNDSNSSKSSNKTVIKAIIVAVLTLAMLIPTTLISNMIIERQANNTPKVNTAARTTNEATVTNTVQSRNYEKTMRTTKYAVLVIGLTFAIFFLIEIMHKKPVHPVQYTLVGLALAIFYTLLLSIGEYILFDYAYIISATATIMLITMYVKSHFQNWKAASALGGTLTGLYGFILVLVSLEDTALIVGSIGLFIVLAIVMYTTRNINWYNPSFHRETGAIS